MNVVFWSGLDRRSRLEFALLAAALLGCATSAGAEATADKTISDLLQRNDVVYRIPTERAEDGLPIGNGDIGTMVWTPQAEGGLAFQMNKVDAFSAGSRSGLYWTTNTLPSLCRLIVRPGKGLHEGMASMSQRLSLYEGTARIFADYGQKSFLRMETYVHAQRPLLVLDMTDTRPDPGRTAAALTLWRIDPAYPERSGARLEMRDGCVVLVQEYRDASHFRRYAVALGAAAGEIETRQEEPRSAGILFAPDEKGRGTLLAAVALSNDPAEDTAARAVAELEKARSLGAAELRREHVAWWQDFWKRCGTFVHLRSNDGAADYIENLWFLALYQTASSSRGSVPPKFNGAVWSADRDNRSWGGQFWSWNTQSFYFPLFAQNAMELTDPLYKMYMGQTEAAKLAARQRWGVGGAHFAETAHFDGPVPFSDAEAAELPAWNLGRPVTLSEATKRRASSDGTMLHIITGRRYAHTSHILSTGSELAMLFWRRYAYSRDVEFLRQTAYPFMKEVAQFYLEYFRKGEDGLYHIYPSNAHENYWGVKDSITDLAAVRGVFPRLIEASRILGLDDDMRPRWQEMLDKLAPYPTGAMPGAKALDASYPEDSLAPGLLGDEAGRKNSSDIIPFPVFPFETMGVGISSPQQLALARATVRANGNWGYALRPESPAAIAWSRIPIHAARVGLVDEYREILSKHAIASHSPRMAPDFDGELGIVRPEYAGILSAAVNDGLLQSHNGLLQILPCWPKEWDARFRLLAEGNIMVQAEQAGGKLLYVSLEPRLDIKATLLNPWPGQTLSCASGGQTKELSGEKIALELKAGVDCRLAPANSSVGPAAAWQVVPRSGDIKSITYKTGDYTYASHLGLGPADTPGGGGKTELPLGPLVLSAEAELPFFGYWYQTAAPTRLAFSEKHGGSLQLTGRVGAEGHLNAVWSSRPGWWYGPNADIGDAVLEAEFIPEGATTFGFVMRLKRANHDRAYLAEQERQKRKPMERGLDPYLAALSFNRGSDLAWINFYGPEPALLRKQAAPFKLKLQDGKPYRLRLTARNYRDLFLRYAVFSLEVFGPDDPQVAAGRGEWTVNLSADNMPDRGEAGIYAALWTTADNKVPDLYVRGFSIRPLPVSSAEGTAK